MSISTVVVVEPEISVLEVEGEDQILVVEEQLVETLELGIAGPQGPPGPEGPAGPVGPPGGSTYVHDQPSASASWTITHNLNRYPSVTVVDTAGSIVDGDVDYVNANQIVLTFSAPFAGAAYLN